MTYLEFISNRFVGKEVHIVASGPSLIGFDYSTLKGKTVIAVNNAYKLVEHDFCVFADRPFPKREAPGITKETTCLSQKNPEFPEIISFVFSNVFSTDPKRGVYIRRSSGATAITIALQGKAERIYLYGFDCCSVTAEGAKKIAEYNGNQNFEPNRSSYMHSTSGIFNHQRDKLSDLHVFEATIDMFKVFPKDQIINMSPISKIPYFRRPNEY